MSLWKRSVAPEQVMDTQNSSVKIDIAPEVLTWARESVGLPLEVAARRLGIKPETLTKMEDGAQPVGIPKLRQMASVYDRPLIAFFLPEPPDEEDRLADFRVLLESESTSWSPALHKAYRRAIGQRQVSLDLGSPDGSPIPHIDLRLLMSDDVEESGQLIRTWLNPPEHPPRDPYAVLNIWVANIEEKGVLVIQLSDVSIEEMRGFSISEHPLPIIALNGSEFPRGKLFTLLHELTHILLHRSGICDLEDVTIANETESQRLEWHCNSVAGAALMPRDSVRRMVREFGDTSNKRWTDDELVELSGSFGVSKEAMLVRLVSLDYATREYYKERRSVFLEQYKDQRINSTGFLTYYPKQIRNLGRRYIRTVWYAYERGDISDPELSTYLRTKLENVPRLIQTAGLD